MAYVEVPTACAVDLPPDAKVHISVCKGIVGMHSRADGMESCAE